ncbi:MAG TPA: nuclear transport factor 2 family protein [Steroidobacteraceae bacterium]|nr:nuclear transport factor 2 family protein [Steroidobacteraceae bacterium]
MRLLLATAILSMGAISACSTDSKTEVATTTDTAESAAVSTADSAQVILDRHVAAMKAGDLAAVMADYADDALVIAPHGITPGETNVGGFNVLEGKDNISKLFAVLTNKDNAAGMASMETNYEFKGSDVALMHWVQFKGTPQELSGTDVWIIRDGKIITQSVLVNPPAAK